jgi:hypothetical protein
MFVLAVVVAVVLSLWGVAFATKTRPPVNTGLPQISVSCPSGVPQDGQLYPGCTLSSSTGTWR